MPYHFEYISKHEERVQSAYDNLIEIINSVHKELKNKFTFQHGIVGSYSRNMMTYDVKSNKGFDFDVNIYPNGEENNFTAKQIKMMLINAINKYAKNAWNALGRGSILFNAENSSTLAYSIKKDESLMKGYLNVYSTWIRFQINHRFSRTGLSFDFEILPTTMFNIKDYQNMYFQGAQFGYSKMRAGVASGIK